MNDKDNEHRERESQLASDVLQKPDEEILKEIFYHSSIPPQHGPQLALNRTLAYFSALLLKLSRQSEESTKKIVILTKTLTYLTWVIAILTAILLLVTFFDF